MVTLVSLNAMEPSVSTLSEQEQAESELHPEISCLRSYHRFVTADGKEIFLIGDVHSNIDASAYSWFVEEAQSSDLIRTLTLLVEYETSANQKDAAPMLKALKHALAQSKRGIHRIDFDPRTSISGKVDGCLTALHSAITYWDQGMAELVKRKKLTKLVMPVDTFTEYLADNREKMEALLDTYHKNKPLCKRIRKAIAQYKEAEEKITELLEQTEEKDFGLALLKPLVTHNMGEGYYDSCSELLTTNTDYSFFECLFFDKICTLLEKKNQLCIIEGDSHVPMVRDLLLLNGCKLLERNTLTSDNPKRNFRDFAAAFRAFLKSLQAGTCSSCEADFESGFLCTKCGKERYCSEDCQKTHWDNAHQTECPGLKKRTKNRKKKKRAQRKKKSANKEIV